MGSQQKSGGTQTTKVEPPAYQLPYLTGALPGAQQLYNQGGPQQYGGNTVTPFSSQTEQAFKGIQDRAANGSPLVDAASNYVQKGLSSPITSNFASAKNPYASGPNPYGGDTNPMLDAQFQHAAQMTQGQLAGEYAGAGRNIGASAPVRGEMLNNLATQIYAPAYENERNRQLQYDTQQQGIGANSWDAGQNRQLQDLSQQRMNQQGLLSNTLPLANQKYVDAGQLANVGGQIENKTGQIIDDRVKRWNYEQQRPGSNFDDYLRRISGNMGESSSTQLPNQHSNPLGGVMGGLLGAGTLGSMMAAPGAAGIAAVGGWPLLLGGAALGGLGSL